MAFPIFASFRSTVTPFNIGGQIIPRLRLLVDAVTGAPTGILNPNNRGPDGIWAPVDLTAAQVAAPTAVMLADLNAVYRLNAAPYTRYYSSGTALIAYAGNRITTNQITYSPFTVTDPAGLAIQSEVHVIAFPA